MMGVQETPARLFYDFCLDDHVPSDHMLRGIERHLELDNLRQSLKPFYSRMGRPWVDPELMIRMLIVGSSMGIRSERRLCEEVHFNLAYRWFAGSDWTAEFLITRPSRRIDMGAFARAMRCVSRSRAWCLLHLADYTSSGEPSERATRSQPHTSPLTSSPSLSRWTFIGG